MGISILVFWGLELSFEDFYGYLLMILVGKSCSHREYRLGVKKAAKFQKKHGCERCMDRKEFGITEVQFGHKAYW